jgi:glycosyltransferase involved in cell wall biosynthesis
MKVLQVIPSVSVVHGGPSRAIVEIERALTARGIIVTTVTTNDDGDRSTLPVKCGMPIALPDATRWYFPRSSVFYKSSIVLGLWLKENIGAFDIVHAHGLFSFAPIAAAIVARRARVPYVLRPLGALHRYGMTRHHPLLKKISFALLERSLIETASAVHFTSRAEQSEAELLKLRCNGVVIPLGIDVDGVLPQPSGGRGNRDERFNLLFLSRIDPKKNLEGLLRAFAFVRRRHPSLVLDIGGDGDPHYVRGLKALVERLHISDHVRWHGYVEGRTKADILASADAFVLPSYSENFGIAVVEGLAAGLPCVVSREVAVSDEIERARAGVVVDTGFESIAAGIEQLVSDATGYPSMSAAARKLAARAFSLSTMGERLEMLYRDCCVASRAGVGPCPAPSRWLYRTPGDRHRA